MVFGLPGYTYVDIVDLGGLEYSTWIRGISGNYSRVKQKVLQNGVMSQVHPIPNTPASSPSLRISPTKMPQKGKFDHLNQLEIISFRDQLEPTGNQLEIIPKLIFRNHSWKSISFRDFQGFTRLREMMMDV